MELATHLLRKHLPDVYVLVKELVDAVVIKTVNLETVVVIDNWKLKENCNVGSIVIDSIKKGIAVFVIRYILLHKHEEHDWDNTNVVYENKGVAYDLESDILVHSNNLEEKFLLDIKFWKIKNYD